MSVLFNFWQVPAEDAQQISDEELLHGEALAFLGPAMEEDGFDLDRGGEIIHYLLTGKAEPHEHALSAAIYGKCSADEDGEYRYSPPSAVKESAAALSALSKAEIEKRFHPEAMRLGGLYDAHHLREDDRPYYLERVEELAQYYREAASQEMGMLIGIG